MEVSLRKDESIRLYLKVFIPIPEICNKIIKLKNDSEYEETYKYHMNRWETIAGEHYYTRDNHNDNFSYVLDGINYIVKPDHRIGFYQITGISYQVLELIYELIKINHENAWDFDFEIDDKKDWLRHDDILFSNLSNKIMLEMRKINI